MAGNRKFRCSVCEDTGLIELEGVPPARQGIKEILERMAPCPMPGCVKGAEKKHQFEILRPEYGL